MQLQINYGDVSVSSALADHVTRRVEHASKHFQNRVTRVEVHLHDDKQRRNGANDARCMMEARLAGCDPMAVTHKADDLYDAVSGAADKLGRVVQHRLARRNGHHRTERRAAG